MGLVHRFIGRSGAYDWEDVSVKHYETGDMKGGSKRVLLGPDEGSNNFRLRYFYIPPGGHSRLEQHAHEHGVYILHGRARVRMGDETVEVKAGDVVYIPGNEWHQFTPLGEEALGFLCIVPAHE
ncbi:MAG: cupin domain-containing protein [Anaerolineae bacterium]